MCKHYLILGKVQGVFYRAYTQEQARKLNITGWVRNTEEGSVEVVACGEDVALTEFEIRLHQGSPQSQVKRVEEKSIEHQVFDGYKIIK